MGDDASEGSRQQLRVLAQPGSDLGYVRRQIHHNDVEEELKSPSRIGEQQFAKLFTILKKLEASSQPPDRVTGVDVIVVVESVEGAVDGVPNNAARADATQDFGKEVIDHPGVTAMTVTAMVVAVFIGVLPGVGEQFIGFQDQLRGAGVRHRGERRSGDC
ncbi:Uncharacterised protein [Mycobacterium tuberculosis]|nr:Uncharacterised protein [Mycobacterium tuberculosis]CNW53967.1 Uncharacterised protein [Mycobacterium tuberculosis]CNW87755.1 Uncharacterised protein [Mycobacterium tuberculosis]CNW88552.1 Uncharacterised protein [Mycobacterium tuberculosis]CNW95302.1 Uncharacterised protein [Mycobacterium tuberculosis]